VSAYWITKYVSGRLVSSRPEKVAVVWLWGPSELGARRRESSRLKWGRGEVEDTLGRRRTRVPPCGSREVVELHMLGGLDGLFVVLLLG
jgi:hypothetical protein